MRLTATMRMRHKGLNIIVRIAQPYGSIRSAGRLAVNRAPQNRIYLFGRQRGAKKKKPKMNIAIKKDETRAGVTHLSPSQASRGR